jgi:peptidoglycan/LPS O-acetylase OafA/YrhL
MKSPQARANLIDGIKAIAMQVIVLHHLASYGPLADATQNIFPDLISGLYDHGRIAVQVFLVIGGYLAARALSPQGVRFRGDLIATIINRYLRLALPYSIALMMAVACAAFARRWIDDPQFISAAPSVSQWLAHLLLLQDVLDYESLSTGVWYVAIDFQLFVSLAILLWMSKAGGRWTQSMGLLGVLALSVASLFWFNRNDDFDIWALYFFGAYGLGAMTYWAKVDVRNAVLGAVFCQRLLWLAVAVALIVDFRWRLVLAFGTAMLLDHESTRANGNFSLLRGSALNMLAMLGRVSYSQFLIHFPVYMLVSALCVKYDLLVGTWNGVVGIVLTWFLSMVTAFMLHRWIEKPVGRMRIGLAV